MQVSADDISTSAANKCTKDGLMCNDCNTVVFCLTSPNGNWSTITVDLCFGDKTCQELPSPKCSSKPNPVCQNPEISINDNIQCHQVGFFPHPFNCREYYVCLADKSGYINPQAIKYKCKEGFGFDPLTKTCRKRLIANKCPSALENPCLNPGKTSPIINNPYMYSICAIGADNKNLYYPQLLNCDKNKIFNGDSCKEPELGLTSKNTCKKRGNFYSPYDDRSFYHCSASGSDPVKRNCLIGATFDPLNKLCKDYTECNV